MQVSSQVKYFVLIMKMNLKYLKVNTKKKNKQNNKKQQSKNGTKTTQRKDTFSVRCCE